MSVPVVCPWGYCSIYLTERGRVDWSVGPMTCPCDHHPGWSAKYVPAMGKPRVLAKARGRHGSRVQRSKKRQTRPSGYMKAFGGLLPARTTGETQ